MDIEQEVSQIVAQKEFDAAIEDFIAALDRVSRNMRELRMAVNEVIDGGN